MNELKAEIAKINKKYGEHTLTFASDPKYSSAPRLSSGSLFLDYALGTNLEEGKSGWGLGHVVELFGPESSGKSLICMRTIAEAQKRKMQCAYIDCENTFDKDFATKLGVDTSKLLISRENGAERVFDIASDILDSYPDVKVIVFDSIASMIPKVEMEASLEDQQMAAVARVMSKGLRKLIAKNKNKAVLLFINQLRTNPGAGMYANPEYTPGGQSIKFYAGFRVDIRRGEYLFDDEQKKKKIGQTVKFRVVKNKTDIPFREGYFRFMYADTTIDKVDELISIATLKGLVDRKGSYYSIGDRSFQGRHAMEKELRENEKFFEATKKEVFA